MKISYPIFNRGEEIFLFFAKRFAYNWARLWYLTAMRTIILYQSKTGNTQKYAEDIAAALKCEAMPIKKFKKKTISDYDTIIFGGRIVGGRIDKAEDFLSMYEDMKDKNVIIFSVGMSETSKEGRNALIQSNLLDLFHVRYYQLRGSFDFEKLGFVEKMLLNNSFRMAARSGQNGLDSTTANWIKEHPVQFYDHAGVDKIISIVRKLETVVDVEVA